MYLHFNGAFEGQHDPINELTFEFCKYKLASMENYLLYEEILRTQRAVSFKGRKKKTLHFLCIQQYNRKDLEFITNEVNAIHDLDQINICRFHEWYETPKHIWCIKELCLGGTLRRIIGEDGRMPEKSVREFSIDIVHALTYLHSNSLAMADLSPEKILLGNDHQLKLYDFCLSKFLPHNPDSFSEPTDSEGEIERARHNLSLLIPEGYSRYHMAPEILVFQAFSPESDFYSLGCIMYEMYTGKVPYPQRNEDIIPAVLYSEPPALPANVRDKAPPSQEFMSLLSLLLQKDCNTRMNDETIEDHSFWLHNRNS
ncbi:Serine/threonine-protein kinase ULK4-like [Oopsacas minuta]|uniref:Serine/threonine-protein kinase ULK4-like n=1 Tax=Oopsacas minuta TaxID=111878 RepID=A0AAV7KK44_9METZ|nr:Serine/threonine-protein kinase ULK4-like [Oopsacas minuta]